MRTATDGGDARTRLSWHAGGQGGTYYPLSNEFKTIVEANSEFTLDVKSTGASVENVGSLQSGTTDFALIQNDVAYFAKNGTSIDAFEGNAVDVLRGVATLYPETITLVTLADTGITEVGDLSGATINTGDLGSGTQVNALQILESLGIEDVEEQNASFSQAADQLRNGDIEAAFVVGGYPVGAIEDLANTNDVLLMAPGLLVSGGYDVLGLPGVAEGSVTLVVDLALRGVGLALFVALLLLNRARGSTSGERGGRPEAA